ncbi:MAG: hypothetical protein DRJ96_03095 [Thermoprotei archaeon]|nr:MAG: hypothetical protein DRJ96_03095 [Thermoprotei archaeon]
MKSLMRRARLEEAWELERKYVVEPFEEVANAYDRGRRGWYRGVLKLLRERVSAPLLDAGCGTGFIACKLALEGLDPVICLEISASMLKIAWRRALRWGVRTSIHPVRASILQLPFRQSSFKSVVAAAVLHHVYGRERRVRALRELLRVSKGHILLTVWSALTPLNIFRVLAARSRDLLVEWRREGRVLHRYYHLYTPCELKRDLREAGYENFKVFAWDYKRRLVKRNIVVEAYA